MKTCVLALLGAAALVLAAAPGSASDEVDYSAPYLTLEDGKLVTRYPAKQHDPQDAAAQPAAGASGEPVPAGAAGAPEGTEPVRASEGRTLPALAAVAVLVVAAGGLLLVRARRRARAPGSR
jgi:lysozyme family protein